MKFQQFAWVDLQKCWSNGGDLFINYFGSKFMIFRSFGLVPNDLLCLDLSLTSEFDIYQNTDNYHVTGRHSSI